MRGVEPLVIDVCLPGTHWLEGPPVEPRRELGALLACVSHGALAQRTRRGARAAAEEAVDAVDAGAAVHAPGERQVSLMPPSSPSDQAFFSLIFFLIILKKTKGKNGALFQY